MIFRLVFIVITFLLFSCQKEKQFTKIDYSGIVFENSLDYTENLNPYTYRNFYNGAGVAMGDINNDGLIDVYLTGNIVDSKMFLNKGDFKFEDITKTAGLACENVWSTGSTFADINGDGFLDLYVCKSGSPDGEKRYNELFINNGDLTFTESSKEYNLDILGLSVQSAFFDYDKDGDLDCYILNNSLRSVGGYDLIENQRLIPDSQGNKLLENREGKFIDVSEQSGIYTSKIGFGLGITLSDYNEDGWTDLFISNDFFEKDYMYINNQDGTFSEKSEEYFHSLSLGSMGADSADLNNDLLTDLIVTEMLPKSLERKKTKAIYDSFDKYQRALSKGYYHQFPRNVLQRNYGKDGFLEIGRYSGISATEWSWASMIFDMNNDGLRDVFIANGIYKDLLDRDYLSYMANEERVRNLIKTEKEVIKKLIDVMPSQSVSNIAYENMGDFNFIDASVKWGLDQLSFSNGTAYADLDNDGDLDMVVNNVNMPVFVYKNNNDNFKRKSISFNLTGEKSNLNAIGSKIILKYGKTKQSMSENFPSRGFQSSISNRIHFGVGNVNQIDSVTVFWPNNKVSYYTNLKTNQTHDLNQNDGIVTVLNDNSNEGLQLTLKTLDFKHKENHFIDFNRERLLPYMVSNEGPALVSADVNKDGVSDFFIGGAKNQVSTLFLSDSGTYKKISAPFEINKASEDVEAVFFDSDNDGDMDLYVASGGKAFSQYDYNLNDRLYLNDGFGNFELSINSINFSKPISTGTVSVSDYDLDGFDDLFIGERFNPTVYGLPSSGYLFRNNGDNTFTNVPTKIFNDIGLITSSKWEDLDNNNYPDLVLAGEWMAIKIYLNDKGDFSKVEPFDVDSSKGLWQDIELVDVDNDNDIDIIAGNLGSNTFFKSEMRMYVNDFDSNGTIEQIICQKINGLYYPILDKDELLKQLPGLKKKIFYYKDYSVASMKDLFDKYLLDNSIYFDLNTTETSLFINNNNQFTRESFPSEIQYSSVYDIEIINNKDLNILSVLFGGNQYLVKPQYGPYDASKGWLVKIKSNNNKSDFLSVESLNIKGQIRKFAPLKMNLFLTAINNDNLKLIEINEK